MSRVVHLADVHLGARPYGKAERTADVLATFHRAITQIIALKPEIVVIAGDLFDRVHLMPDVICDGFTAMRRLTSGLPGTAFCIAAGNHELPKVWTVPSILPLFRHLGVRIAERGPLQVRIGEVAVTLSPDPLRTKRKLLAPDASARWNLLVLHGRLPVEGNTHYVPETTVEALGAWDLICAGDYHTMHQVGPRAWYSGSLDRVDSNPWATLDVPKGFLEHDLAAGTTIFHAVEPSRLYVDLEPIAGLSLTAAEIDAAIAERVAGVSIDGAVVRLRVYDVEPEVNRELDWTAIRRLKARALHFALPIEKPETIRVSGQGPLRKKGVSIEDLLAASLRRRVEESNGDVDLDALVALGNKIMDEVAEKDTPTSEREPLLPNITEAAA